MIGGDGAPLAIVQGIGPTVTVTRPGCSRESLKHFLVQLTRRVIIGQGKALISEHIQQGCTRFFLLQQTVKLAQAGVAATPFGQGVRELQPRFGHNVGQVFIDHLLLQRHRCGGNHQPLIRCLRHNHRRQHVTYGFAGAGTGLNDGNREITSAPTFAVGIDIAKCPGNFGNHLLLPGPGL